MFADQWPPRLDTAEMSGIGSVDRPTNCLSLSCGQWSMIFIGSRLDGRTTGVEQLHLDVSHHAPRSLGTWDEWPRDAELAENTVIRTHKHFNDFSYL